MGFSALQTPIRLFGHDLFEDSDILILLVTLDCGFLALRMVPAGLAHITLDPRLSVSVEDGSLVGIGIDLETILAVLLLSVVGHASFTERCFPAVRKGHGTVRLVYIWDAKPIKAFYLCLSLLGLGILMLLVVFRFYLVSLTTPIGFFVSFLSLGRGFICDVLQQMSP